MIQDIPSTEAGRMPARVVNASTGIIGVDGANPDGAGLRFAGYLSEIIVTNQGDISGVGNAVENFNGHIGMTLTNQVGGTITGDTDGLNGGAAIQSIELWDIQVTALVQWLPVGEVPGVDANYLEADTPALITFNGVAPIAPLVDGGGNLVVDGWGNPVFPHVDLSGYGVGTVTFVADEFGTYFGEDSSANPLHYYPPGFDFTDSIVNDGDIIGDVNLGLGNDSYTGTGTVSGTVRGGPGSDDITAGASGLAMAGGEDDDVLTGGVGNDWLEGGEGVDTLTGGSGDDIFTFNLPSEFGDIIADFGTGTDSDLLALNTEIFASQLFTSEGVNNLHHFSIQGTTLMELTADTLVAPTLSLLGSFASSSALITALTGLVMKQGTATMTGIGIGFAMVGSDLKMFTIDNSLSAAITAGEIGTLDTIATFSNGATPDLILI